MTESITYDLGEFNCNPYFLRIRATPSLEQCEDFAVVLHYNDSIKEESVQIARIDNSHGYVHFDKLFRKGKPKDEFNGGIWEAVEHLINNWRRYAQSYERK